LNFVFYLIAVSSSFNVRINDSENMTHSSKISNSPESWTCFTPINIK